MFCVVLATDKLNSALFSAAAAGCSYIQIWESNASARKLPCASVHALCSSPPCVVPFFSAVQNRQVWSSGLYSVCVPRDEVGNRRHVNRIPGGDNYRVLVEILNRPTISLWHILCMINYSHHQLRWTRPRMPMAINGIKALNEKFARNF